MARKPISHFNFCIQLSIQAKNEDDPKYTANEISQKAQAKSKVLVYHVIIIIKAFLNQSWSIIGDFIS